MVTRNIGQIPLAIVLALAGCLSAMPPLHADDLVGQATVIDGDTIEVQGQRIRFHGIDAPESSQSCADAAGNSYRCGQVAALALAERIARRTVSCDGRDVDRYGRIVAVCAAGGEDLNAWLVASGRAVAYRRYSMDYVPQETAARAAGLGLWAGTFAMPWDWRKKGSAAVAAPANDNQPLPADQCLVKGNINGRGERIYHVPGGRYYDKTRIDKAGGERWFCSEAEAQAAGWRPAR